MIQVTGLTRYYDAYPAISDVDLNIEDKVIVGFLGLNGAGKSTLLKMLSRVLPPHGGTIKIDGVDIWEDNNAVQTKIGYLPEEPALYRDMRVTDFLKWCGRLRGMSADDVHNALPRVMSMCDLEGKEEVVIGALSHGFKKRVGIAQAIIHSPALLILDEPISGLDPLQIIEMRALLKRLKQDCTVLVSSHILTEISQVCDRILVIKEGRIVADGTESDIAMLSGSYQYALETIDLNEDEARELFGKIPLVTSFTKTDSHRFSILLNQDQPEVIVRTVIKAGYSVRTMIPNAEELEKTFAKILESTENS